jgi:hypothetical protein
LRDRDRRLFFISAGGPAFGRKSSHLAQIFPRQLLQPEAHCKTVAGRTGMNAKAAFLAFTCILIAGVSNATADELLDLETRDLAEMKTVSGITVVFDPGKISMIYTLPRSWDRHPAEAAQQRT